MTGISELAAAAAMRWDLTAANIDFNKKQVEEILRQAGEEASRLEGENDRLLRGNSTFAVSALKDHGLAALSNPSLCLFIYQTLRDAGWKPTPVSVLLNEVLSENIPFFEYAYVDGIRGREIHDDALSVSLLIPLDAYEDEVDKAAKLLDPIMWTQLDVFPRLHDGNTYDVPSVSVGISPKDDVSRSIVWIVDRQYQIPEPLGGGVFPDLYTALTEARKRAVEAGERYRRKHGPDAG